MAINLQRLVDLVVRYPRLACISGDIRKAAEVIVESYENDGTVFCVGNGGSASDASHIVGELMKGFVKRRPVSVEDRERFGSFPDGNYLSEHLQEGLPAISLMSQEAITTAVQNDNGGDLGPAQQLFAMGRPGDVLIAISTSGNARNVYLACQVAKMKGMTVIGLTGRDGGRLKSASDVCIIVPERETYKIQEYHLPIYHALCILVEEAFFDE